MTLLIRAAISVCLGVATQAWAVCSATEVTLDGGVERSGWTETDASGRRLLRESGNLNTLGLRVDTACASLRWTAALSQARGSRHYAGLTTSGAPLETRSAMARRGIELGVMSEVPDLAAGLAIGARLGYRQIDRDIAGADKVQGYLEQFASWHLAAGVRQQLAQWGETRLVAEAWLGAGPGGSVRLRLPNADPADLPLGASRMVEAGLSVQRGIGSATAASSWTWRVGLDYRQELIGAGAAQVLRRQGNPVGGAAQPQIRQSALRLQAGLRYGF